MVSSQVKNVVFDIGNVMVRWSPHEIVRLTFGDGDETERTATEIFQSSIWLDLNKGLLTEPEAKTRYQAALGLSALECERLFYYVKQTQILLYGSESLLKRVKAAGYRVYALTDNVHEIVEFLQSTYRFWSLFDGATVSADLGLLKPQPEIYQSLLTQHKIEAVETVFIDDMPHNIAGAEAVGLYGIQYKNAAQCEADLKALGLAF
uniref:HAD family hydrolase n=1 Tax=Thaumasiovibrio occultus TaxID=1891184 RepID=UPI000B34D7EF|nr:HAD family phosphatase [Thaumasiovibrio occultus]